jgi:hypothetical protein
LRVRAVTGPHRRRQAPPGQPAQQQRTPTGPANASSGDPPFSRATQTKEPFAASAPLRDARVVAVCNHPGQWAIEPMTCPASRGRPPATLTRPVATGEACPTCVAARGEGTIDRRDSGTLDEAPDCRSGCPRVEEGPSAPKHLARHARRSKLPMAERKYPRTLDWRIGRSSARATHLHRRPCVGWKRR